MIIHKKFCLTLIVAIIGLTSFGQLSYNTQLLGQWSNDSLPALNNNNGQRFNELWGYFDSSRSREYIIMGSVDSTYFFDVTNPKKIRLCDVEAGKTKGCVNRDYQTYKHYAYAVNDQSSGSLQVFDLQYLPDSVHKVYDDDTLGRTTHTICVYKDKLYMCSNTLNNKDFHAMRIASLAQPDSPTFITTFDGPILGGNKLFGNIHDMMIFDDTAYLSCGNDGLHIFDFKNPLAPKYIYSITQYPEKGFNHNSWLTLDKKHIVFTDENLGLGVKLYEIENPTSYRLKSMLRSHIGAIAHNPFIQGNNSLYLSYYQDGVYKFDISDVTNPKVVAYYDTYTENTSYTGFQGCWGVYPYLPSGNIFASDMSHGLFALSMNATGIKTIQHNESLSIQPNPTKDETTVKLFSPVEDFGVLNVIDATGKIVDTKKMLLNTGKNCLQLTTASYETGIYFLQITTSTAIYTSKLVKE